jgi:hypothetical protein
MKKITIETEHGPIEYVPVNERIKQLKVDKVDYSSETEYKYFEAERMFIVKATLTVFSPNKERSYTGHASETVGEGNEANILSALENAETSAVGRALAFFGVGIDNAIASAEEIKKAVALSPDQVLAKLDEHLKTITTEGDLDKVAGDFQKKYADLYKQVAVRNRFKKRKGEIIAGSTLVK